MNLSVSQRIAGGFAVVCGFLLIIAVVSLMSLRSIQSDLEKVADQATPMVVQGGELSTGLLESSRAASRHFNSQDDAEIAAATTSYQEAADRYQQGYAQLQKLVAGDDELTSALAEVDELAKSYFERVPQMFTAHQNELASAKKVRSLRGNFEDLADTLGADLSDLAETGRNEIRAVARRISKLTDEGTVTAIDALAIKKMASLETAIRELGSLDESLTEQIAAFRAAGGNSAILAELEKYRTMLVGPGSMVNAYRTQIEQAEQARELFITAEQELGATLKAVNALLADVEAFKNEAKESALSATSTANLIVLVSCLVALVLAGLIAFQVTASIVSRLNRFVTALGQIANGDMTVRVDVESKDELGHLGESVNTLTSQLRKMLRSITDASLSLASSAEQSNAISRSTNEAIRVQREQTEQVVVAMTEMSSTVEEVARSAGNTLQQVNNADKETSAGHRVVSSSIEAINRLAQEVENSVQVINRLDSYSDQIGTVLDVIRGIAEQTNLLALNAAIEAARAGEQGRGFAVVADEVRTLASRTQQSTAEIQQTIERLQQGAREAVQVMARSRQEAEASVSQTAQAGESLGRITQSMSVINDMSTQIASAAEEQTAVTQEMHRNMTQIASAAERTSDGAEQNLKASQELARLADELQKMVKQFTI
ncbi:HAMP domain-containing methyl-accepting chemotaxis protein [Permianibacter aggregans]|uniref:Methyl-accepting chemotaxis sensory transducer n=1 Tax=Permianibacter aggregans TaxID=1510150 RepID=A0A4R6URC1_9GAMM|nr:methyl-accepting chemotaxis protein [Permianibacter aggregans]QGX41069.1 methyl-accepting chemotaxis protein [Permianibacter aggregans]TDQ48133.1 methyl-accepting chemotaxis sensory transducer [Permianibacter aggregans]